MKVEMIVCKGGCLVVVSGEMWRGGAGSRTEGGAASLIVTDPRPEDKTLSKTESPGESAGGCVVVKWGQD